MTRAVVAAAVFAALLTQATPAFAHAERSASTPKEGATVAAPPDALSITFTEPPTGAAVVEVVDGCGRDIVENVDTQDLELDAALAEGQPGRWTVQSNVMSAVDGHNTRDRWTFTVRGEPDCSEPETEAPDAAADDEEAGDGGGSALPLIPIVGGTLVLVLVGLMLRGRGS